MPMRRAAIVSLLWIASPLFTAGHFLFKHRDDPLAIRPRLDIGLITREKQNAHV
jgi:hypothetical protein